MRGGIRTFGPTTRRALCILLGGSVAAACANVLGIEDPAGHLPDASLADTEMVEAGPDVSEADVREDAQSDVQADVPAADVLPDVSLTDAGVVNLLWQNAEAGVLSAWTISGTTLLEKLDLTCPFTSDGRCLSQANAVDTWGNSMFWYNASGELFKWAWGPTGIVTQGPAFGATTCASGCYGIWRPIGLVAQGGEKASATAASAPCPLWHDATSGELGIWVMKGDVVESTQFLTVSCGPDDGCATTWWATLTADFNGDGNTDLLWYATQTGALRLWLLGSDLTVTGMPNLSWSCTSAVGCSSTSSVVGAADVNGDGHLDLTWYDSASGAVVSWLLDGKTNVIGTQTLSQTLPQTCSHDGGACESPWAPLGYISFPQ